MRAKNKIYHIDCFRCVACSRQLIPGDEFALRDDGLFCKADHDVVENASTGSTTPNPVHEDAKMNILNNNNNNNNNKDTKNGINDGEYHDLLQPQTPAVCLVYILTHGIFKHVPLFWGIFQCQDSSFPHSLVIITPSDLFTPAHGQKGLFTV